jgi:protein phosphatase
MGGHQAGEVAAAIAVELLADAANGPAAPDGAEVARVLERSNAAIRAQARQRPELDGMGTTCTVAVVSNGSVEIAHVGDSRAYLFRAGDLRQLTEDHSLVAGMVREGILDADEASSDGRRNIITRALGADDEVRVDRVSMALEPGDRLLLCSDGLSGQVPDASTAEVLATEPDPARAVDRLVGLANAAGGEDNVTVVVIDPDRLSENPASPALDAPPRRRSGPRPTSVVLIGVLAVALAVAGTRALTGDLDPSPSPTVSTAPSTAPPPSSTAPPSSASPSPTASPSVTVSRTPTGSTRPNVRRAGGVPYSLADLGAAGRDQ